MKARPSITRPGCVRASAAALCAAAALLALPAAASAAAPTITATSFSEVAETAATLHAEVNPQSREVEDAHFQYITQADWEADGDSFGAGTQLTEAQTIPSGAAPVAIEARPTGLAPGTAYRLRAYAKSRSGTTEGPEEATFTTLSGPQAFGPCPANEAFRAAGSPSAALPDCRAYEQVSPTDKRGVELAYDILINRASSDGERVAFMTAAALPGGGDAHSFNPSYLAARGPGGWSTEGVEPPVAYGALDHLDGFSPDLSHFFVSATALGEPNLTTLLDRSSATGAFATIAGPAPNLYPPLVPGSAADGSVVYFANKELSTPGLLAGEAPGSPNLYVSDRATGALRLAGVLNDGGAPTAGVVAGEDEPPLAFTLAHAQRAVSADGRSVFFSALASSQLYQRLNATEPQSPMEGEACEDPALACTLHVSATEKTNGQSLTGADPAGPQPATFAAGAADGSAALFTSPEKLTNDANTGPEQPEAAIGRAKLGATEPEEEEPSFLPAHARGLATDPSGTHLYWANPTDGTVARATIDPTACAPGPAPCEVEPDFIEPGQTECEGQISGHPDYEHASGPADPRYLAVDEEHVYWTNTGPRDPASGKALGGCGTIGRATLDPSTGALAIDPVTAEPEVEAQWIPGERETGPGEYEVLVTNPQGIAVDGEHVYWANNGASDVVYPGNTYISRATIEGEEVEPHFYLPKRGGLPYGLALDSTYLYFASDEDSSHSGYIERIPLAGGEEQGFFAGEGHGEIRGIALQGPYVYWANRDAVGRYLLSEFTPGNNCAAGQAENCEPEYLPTGGEPQGLATGPESRLYFSVNGDAPTNPGTDLYRWARAADAEGHHLTDLTADPGAEDGAEVKAVLGASADASRAYFIANAVLTTAPNAAGEEAEAGDCSANNGPHGQCSLYLTDEGHVSFLARLDAASDSKDWAKTNGANGDGLPTARVSPDGRALLFASVRSLTAYHSHGHSELYLYREGRGIACLSCNPSGQAPSAAFPPELTLREGFNEKELSASPVLPRNLSASAQRAFFESSEALIGADTDEQTDVYEWEAAGAGSCTEAAAPYSPQDEGCLYLLSPGSDSGPAFFLDADEEGENVFLLTRAQLVGQDRDGLLDLYDARALGGLASQQQPAQASEGCPSPEACKGPAPPAPTLASPATPFFKGPGNVVQKPSCPKGKRAVRRRGKLRCVKRHHSHHHRRGHHKRAHRKGRNHR